MRIRLAPNERRQLIVEAAMPLFARKGFSGTTTKEIAEAAQVSEGLLFKYFANKTALYDAIIDYCRDDNPKRFAALAELPPSTATLAETVHHLMFYFLTVTARSPAEQSRQRLFMQSLVEDGEFVRLAMSAYMEAVMPQIERSFDAARASGDVNGDISTVRAFWLMGLLQIMMGGFALHKLQPDDVASTDEWVAEATRFILRGMGVTDAAITRAYKPERIVTDPVDATAVTAPDAPKENREPEIKTEYRAKRARVA
ncbi:MAG: TetR/AcrR family transcriptional regulator [Rhodospirillaceae bacterium]|nr:TetR/AcrR family transcriptional regulator [Rhodospirillaceae bacterium]